MAKLDRRSVLFGSLGGVAVGAAAGFVSGSLGRSTPTLVPPFVADGMKPSYAQQGEDLVVQSVLGLFKIAKPSYFDIGAHHPSINSNTYLLYKNGGRGVLAEPNPSYASLLRDRRPGDVVLEVGIGVTNETEANYYVMGGDGQRNTFSKEQADELTKLNPGAVKEVLKRPLVNVNEVMAREFPSGGPDFVSIDVEGLDFEILRTFDFERRRPKVFCVETSLLDGAIHQGILDLMASKAYAVRGGSFVNTVFIDERARAAAVVDAGLEHIGHGH